MTNQDIVTILFHDLQVSPKVIAKTLGDQLDSTVVEGIMNGDVVCVSPFAPYEFYKTQLLPLLEKELDKRAEGIDDAGWLVAKGAELSRRLAVEAQGQGKEGGLSEVMSCIRREYELLKKVSL